jgi:hypothetical protein
LGDIKYRIGQNVEGSGRGLLQVLYRPWPEKNIDIDDINKERKKERSKQIRKKRETHKFNS